MEGLICLFILFYFIFWKKKVGPLAMLHGLHEIDRAADELGLLEEGSARRYHAMFMERKPVDGILSGVCVCVCVWPLIADVFELV